MASIIWDVSVSLDGFTTGPNVRADAPMGDGGEALHHWLGMTGVEAAMVDVINADLGASIIGRRTFDLGQRFWGGTPWADTDCFVVTHRPLRDFIADNGGRFIFCALDEAAQRARATAGTRNINILGADVARQLLRAGAVDILRLHTVPIVLGGGTPLFTGETVALEPLDQPSFGSVVHQTFRILKPDAAAGTTGPARGL